MAYQKVVKTFSKSLVLNPSKWVHILRSLITRHLQVQLSEILVDVWLYSQQKTKPSDWGQSPWSCLRPFKPQTVAEAAVARIPGSKHRVGMLGSVRFWQQWSRTINIKQPWKNYYTYFFNVFYVFWRSKNTTFYVFWVVAHVLEHWPTHIERLYRVSLD